MSVSPEAGEFAVRPYERVREITAARSTVEDIWRKPKDTDQILLHPGGYLRLGAMIRERVVTFVPVDIRMEDHAMTAFAAAEVNLEWVRLFFVDGPGGFCERHGKSYLARRRRGGEGGGGGSLSGGAIPSAYRRAWFRWYSRFVEVPVREVAAGS